MINSGAEYLKSPLLDADPEQYDLRQLGDELEKELKSMASGDYSPSFTDENLVNYSFEDSIQNQNPSWWRPRVIARLEQKDPTVEKWMETVEQGLDGNENYTLVRKDCLDPLTGENHRFMSRLETTNR